MTKQFRGFFAPLLMLVVLLSPVISRAQNAIAQFQTESIVSSSGANFADSLDSAAGIIVVGAPREETAAGDQAGIIALYQEMPMAMAPSSWDYCQTVTPPDARAGANFGNAVAIRGDWIMAGAEFDAGFAAFALGKAYMFYLNRFLNTVSWNSTLVPQTASNFDQWGSKLALGTDFA
jgi:hypothetical protein